MSTSSTSRPPKRSASLKGSMSATQVQQQAARQPAKLSEMISIVFEEMVNGNANVRAAVRLGKIAGDEEDHVLPAKFWEFHQTRVHRLFLACLLRYFRANQEYEKLGGGMEGEEDSSLKDLSSRRRQSRAQSGLVDAPAKAAPTDVERRALEKARKARTTALEKFSRAYAKVVLYCSNFENSKEDERFFEALYRFSKLVLYKTVPSEDKQKVDTALEFVFRGHLFTGSYFKRIYDRAGEAEGVAGGEGMSGTGVGVGDSPGGEGSSATAQSVPKLPLAAMPRRKRRDEFDPVGSARQTSERLGLRFWAPGVRRGGKRSPRGQASISIHAAIHARSPIISFLLPTPQERLANKKRELQDLRRMQNKGAKQKRGISPREQRMVAKGGTGGGRGRAGVLTHE